MLFSKRTENSVSSVNFNRNNIFKIMQNLDHNKAHVHDKISIHVIEISDDSIIKPLQMIFKSFMEIGIFPNEWKKMNFVPIYKKGDKQELKNYSSVSLLPICGKILEQLIYNNLLELLINNDLISSI